MATMHRLKLSGDPSSLQNGHKVEVEVDGIEGAKLLLLKVEGNLRVLSPRCTRMFPGLCLIIFVSSGVVFGANTVFTVRLWSTSCEGRVNRGWENHLPMAWGVL